MTVFVTGYKYNLLARTRPRSKSIHMPGISPIAFFTCISFFLWCHIGVRLHLAVHSLIEWPNTGAAEGCKSAEVEGRIPEAGETGNRAEEADNRAEGPAAEGWASDHDIAAVAAAEREEMLACACPPSELGSPG